MTIVTTRLILIIIVLMTKTSKSTVERHQDSFGVKGRVILLQLLSPFEILNITLLVFLEPTSGSM